MNNKIIQATTSIIKFDNQITVPISKITSSDYGFAIPTNSERYLVYYGASLTIRDDGGSNDPSDATTRTTQVSNMGIWYKSDNYIRVFTRVTNVGFIGNRISGQAKFFY